jgi:hypothetical protein
LIFSRSGGAFCFLLVPVIRDAVVLLPSRWHPLFVFGLLALPLCGAAPTFLCSGKEK